LLRLFTDGRRCQQEVAKLRLYGTWDRTQPSYARVSSEGKVGKWEQEDYARRI